MKRNTLGRMSFVAAAAGGLALSVSASADAPIPNVTRQDAPKLHEIHNCAVTRMASNDAIYTSRVLSFEGRDRLVVTMELQGQRPRAFLTPEGTTVQDAKTAANATCAQVASQLQGAAGMPMSVRKPTLI